ncbi:MFS transporter [Ideonella livida]|uniref:MFS transporter n=1 Tax=Ideonella livida TaxID=2707176 RepID=A0A7C9TN36_9BURK|nr:MFS transporter [Ideonella livida]NDY93463.1 MFS transporter [Ideonella livida]
MSTVLAVATPQAIVIGSETLLMQGETRLGHAYGDNPKLYTVGHSCIGLTGTVAHYSALILALRSLGEDCRLGSVEQVFETFNRVHRKLKDEFFLNPKKQPDDAYEANHISALVANGSGLYGVYAHREVLRFDRFWANGTGRPYALGAMHCAWNAAQDSGAAPDALAIARQGLGAAMEFDRASGGAMRLYRFMPGSDAGPECLTPPT